MSIDMLFHSEDYTEEERRAALESIEDPLIREWMAGFVIGECDEYCFAFDGVFTYPELLHWNEKVATVDPKVYTTKGYFRGIVRWSKWRCGEETDFLKAAKREMQWRRQEARRQQREQEQLKLARKQVRALRKFARTGNPEAFNSLPPEYRPSPNSSE